MAHLSERTIKWMEGIQEENERVAQMNERLVEENAALGAEIRELKSQNKAVVDLKAAVAGALTNLASVDTMSGAPVTNQAAAKRQLQDALVKANARGPMDP
jgi:hypothetical protein